MVKINKKGILNPKMGGFLLIVVLGLIIYFGFFSTGDLFPYGSASSIQLQSSTSNSNTFLIQVANKNPTTGGCNVPPTSQINFNEYSFALNTYYVDSTSNYKWSGTYPKDFSDLSHNPTQINSGGFVSGNPSVQISNGTCTALDTRLICTLYTSAPFIPCYTQNYQFSVTIPKATAQTETVTTQTTQTSSNTNGVSSQVISETPVIPWYYKIPVLGDILKWIFGGGK